MNKTLLESDLEDAGFTKHLMDGTGWNSISSMQDPIYWYKNDRISINATTIWTWFLDGEQRNDIAVHTKDELSALITNTRLDLTENLSDKIDLI